MVAIAVSAAVTVHAAVPPVVAATGIPIGMVDAATVTAIIAAITGMIEDTAVTVVHG